MGPIEVFQYFSNLDSIPTFLVNFALILRALIRLNASSAEDINIANRKLLVRFDPEDDKLDRKALFEVTGIRLYEDDFLDSDTSDEEVVA